MWIITTGFHELWHYQHSCDPVCKGGQVVDKLVGAQPNLILLKRLSSINNQFG